jgi:UDP-N-acetylmuramoyl-L-alanyl-D-glutamate--2,6-diaminopimelate ligase
MRLSNLIASSDGLKRYGDDIDITGLTDDSRKVLPGNLFVAVPGNETDGSTFIAEALLRGARAILIPEGKDITPAGGAVTTLTTPNIRVTLSKIAAQFYRRQPDIVAAVTGTSGKTSTAQFTREIWQTLGYRAGSMGSLGLILPDSKEYSSINTPGPIDLHKRLEKAADQNVTHLVMEASSHGLAMRRMDNVLLKAAGFTNLSHDHLDYHLTMSEYLAAKSRLFSELLSPGSAAVLNADIPEFGALMKIVEARRLKVISYGQKAKEIKLIESLPDSKGQLLTFELFGKKHQAVLPVIGAFQAWNALCALGLAIGCGADMDNAVDALSQITGVAGRLELTGHTKAGAAIFVDYAHKPDALKNVLKALRPHVAAHPGAKLGVVFGCGGNRDKTKRPIMGEIAQRLADWVIVTDDNPRHEEPATIRREIMAGCKPTKTLQEIADRATAIAAGIRKLQAHDVLIIAGKGHENGQIVGDATLPFDDAEVARKVLQS